jgi:hypothetical protein
MPEISGKAHPGRARRIGPRRGLFPLNRLAPCSSQLTWRGSRRQVPISEACWNRNAVCLRAAGRIGAPISRRLAPFLRIASIHLSFAISTAFGTGRTIRRKVIALGAPVASEDALRSRIALGLAPALGGCARAQSQRTQRQSTDPHTADEAQPVAISIVTGTAQHFRWQSTVRTDRDCLVADHQIFGPAESKLATPCPHSPARAFR